MPKFIDHHAIGPATPETTEFIRGRVQAGQPDEFGVKPVNVYLGNGEAWCISEAADAEAVCRSHAALGIQLERSAVNEVTSVG